MKGFQLILISFLALSMTQGCKKSESASDLQSVVPKTPKEPNPARATMYHIHAPPPRGDSFTITSVQKQSEPKTITISEHELRSYFGNQSLVRHYFIETLKQSNLGGRSISQILSAGPQISEVFLLSNAVKNQTEEKRLKKPKNQNGLNLYGDGPGAGGTKDENDDTHEEDQAKYTATSQELKQYAGWLRSADRKAQRVIDFVRQHRIDPGKPGRLSFDAKCHRTDRKIVTKPVLKSLCHFMQEQLK